jgi:hypothetical protein
VATASVSGGGAPGKATDVELKPSTLYDFSKEQLGSNSLLKLPPSSFRYLHVKLSSGIRPEQVKGATIANRREQQALWTHVGWCAAPTQRQRKSEIICEIPPRVPVNRIMLQVVPTQVNFRRTVSVEDSRGLQIASGEVSRVRVNRAGTLIINEDLAVSVSVVNVSALNEGEANSRNPLHFTLIIDNGDNPPLTVVAAEPLALERRDASATQAQLGPGAHNMQYTGRPDERPWSERHKAVLWAAMILAVLALAVVALRGLRTEPAR